jgi:hypothetical protein
MAAAPSTLDPRPGPPLPATPPPTPPPPRSGRSPLMRAFGVLAVMGALLVVGWGCFALVDLMALRTYHETASYPVVGALDLHLGDGDVILIPDAGDRIVVDRTIRRGLRPAAFGASEQSGTLVVDGGCGDRFGLYCSMSTTIHVPPDLVIRGRLGDGTFSARGITGGLQVTTGDGDVHLSQMTGPVRLSTGDGDVDATGLAATTANVSTGDGDVHLEFATSPRSIRLDTGDGDVQVCLPPGAPPYAMTTHRGDGSLDNEVPSDPSAPRTMVVSTGDGDVSLRLC